MFDIKFLLIGFIIGIACIAPGVSGGSLAIAFGIYERMINCVVHFKTKIKDEIGFILPLGIGAICGIAVFALGLNFLFDRYEFIMRMMFAGLMLGTFPQVYNAACKQGFKNYYPMLFICTMMLSLFGFNAIQTNGEMPINIYTSSLMGLVIGVGTIIPGVSDSALLMALGLYKPMLEGFTELNFYIIIPAAISALITIIILLKVVEWLFSRYYGAASFVFFGLLGGSAAAIVPEVTAFNGQLVVAIIFAIIGARCSLYFGKKFAE